MRKTLVINLLLIVAAFSGLLLFAEIYFRFQEPSTDGFGVSNSSSRWMKAYWTPVNSLGFRDFEPSDVDASYLVVGDSFVAGHGIKNIKSRFSHVLGANLESPEVVNIIAQNGWGPAQQLEAFKKYPVNAGIVIFSYFINDIDDVARATSGMKWSRPRLQASLPGRLLYKAGLYSRAIDWLSVAVVYPNMLAKSNNSYMQMISKAYSDERIFARHMNEIDGLVEAAESVGSRPVFVLWPNLVDPLGTRWMVAKVKAHLQNQGIPAVDLSEYVLSFDLDKRTVNPLDAHPSEELNFSLGLSLARCLPLLSSDVSSYSLQNCIEANV